MIIDPKGPIMRIAGVTLDAEESQGLVTTLIMPDCPIQDGDTTVIPADDLFGFVTREHLGLDPATLTDQQRAEIEKIIRDYSV
jgi:hypothetical protein